MVSIRHARRDDLASIAEILEELDRYYGATDIDPVDIRTHQINEAIFTDPPSAYALTAWHDTTLVGFASYSFHWPAAGLTRSLFLKELYVTQQYRRTGIGKMLMETLTEIASEKSCSRVEWTTDTHSDGAQKFYDAIGVHRDHTKIFYRLEAQDLAQRSETTSMGDPEQW